MELPWKFRLWSEISHSAKEKLQPTILWRSWSQLTADEKNVMLRYLNNSHYFYGVELNSHRREIPEIELVVSINELNQKYKRSSFGRNFLNRRGASAAHEDFVSIWHEGSEILVFELLSLYAKQLYEEKEAESFLKLHGETDENFKKRNINWRMESLDKFRNILNELFEQFNVNMFLTRAGFIPYQEKKIVKNAYEPVVNFLTDPRWKTAERELGDAFEAFAKKEEKNYSKCITHCFSAVQAFLQELVQSDIPDANINSLLKEAKTKELIPKDIFSETAFSKLQEALEEMRKKYGDPHPKKEYANEKNALLALNITVVFLQHCMTFS